MRFDDSGAEIVGDDGDRRIEVAGEIRHQLQDLRLHRDVDGTVPPWTIEVRDARNVSVYSGTLAQFIVDNDIDAAEVEAMVRDMRSVGQHRWPANEADGIDYVVKLSPVIEQQQGWLP